MADSQSILSSIGNALASLYGPSGLIRPGSQGPVPNPNFHPAPVADPNGPLIQAGPELVPMLKRMDQSLPGQSITGSQPTPTPPSLTSDPLQAVSANFTDKGVTSNTRIEPPVRQPVEQNITISKAPDNIDAIVNRYFGPKANEWYQAMSGENAAHNPRAENTANADGSIDRGLMQINSNTFKDYLSRFPNQMKSAGITSFNDMYDPEKNIAMGKMIYDRNGWNAWYGSPQYLKH